MMIIPVIAKDSDLLFGHAPHPLIIGHGVAIGAGMVHPEIKFTLPPLEIREETWQRIREIYTEMITDICRRCVDLHCSALVVEFELLPPMTHHPEWGSEITELIRNILEEFHEKYGLNSAFRVTPVDIRDNERPPRLRSGDLLEKTLKTFELCARAGADLLSIESTGGKELHDHALVWGDLGAIIFSLGVLAPRDMDFLWTQIVDICRKTNTIPAGDSACGFANTAMVLADRGMIPKTLAALVRVASVPRSLVAYMKGAQGPSKDCAYEGPYLKVLSGIPISMEGKSSACAHLSPVGNIAACCADLWSNESVQNVRLLSGPAPVVSMEQLIYDCRLMNVALQEGRDSAVKLRDWLADSDSPLDPQAYVLRPDVVLKICERLACATTPLEMTFFAVEETLTTLREALAGKRLSMPEKEIHWLDLLSAQLEILPREEESLWRQVQSSLGDVKINPAEYLLSPISS